MASTYLTRTPASAGNRKTFTISAWVKRGTLGNTQNIIDARVDSNTFGTLYFDVSDVLVGKLKISSSINTSIITTRVFRDTSAWYHIVWEVDTTQSTESERSKLYVNGSEINYSSSTYPQQNNDTAFNNTTEHRIGGRVDRTDQNFDGSLAHFHFIDGTAYDSDTFGETDSTTGIWKPKTAPSVTYGTNGFFLKFENSGAFGTDSSGNGNNFTVNGTMTQTIDTPSNVFATLNPLWRSLYNPVFSNGNLRMATPAVNEFHNSISSLGVSSGKWYLEMKCNGSPNSANYFGIGNEDEIDDFSQASTVIGNTTQGFSITLQTGNKRTNGTNTSYGSAFANGDIMMYAIDLDNGKVWFGKNGTWFASGDPAAGTNEAFSGLSGTFFIGGSVYNGGFSSVDFNFGNGYFGTTAVSSAQNPDDGVGIFEYSPPTGYKALCTKSINSQEYD